MTVPLVCTDHGGCGRSSRLGNDTIALISLSLSLLPPFSLHTHALSLFLLSHSLTHSHSKKKKAESSRTKTCYARKLRVRSAGTCFQMNIALTPEQIRVDWRRLWLAKRGKHHRRIPSLEHDAEPTAPTSETGCCDVCCLDRRPRHQAALQLSNCASTPAALALEARETSLAVHPEISSLPHSRSFRRCSLLRPHSLTHTHTHTLPLSYSLFDSHPLTLFLLDAE